MEFGKSFVTKVRRWLTKWKLVDTTKYDVLKFPRPTLTFSLTKWQQEQVDKLYKQHGSMDYCFYFVGGIGVGFKVKLWKTGEWIDLTDVSDW